MLSELEETTTEPVSDKDLSIRLAYVAIPPINQHIVKTKA